MIRQTTLTLPPFRPGFHLITTEVLKSLGPITGSGLLHVFIKHTSAGLAVNENDDATVRSDLTDFFDQIAPESRSYRHNAEGPDDMPAHIKSVLIGSSVTVPVTDGKLNLGSWQGIYLCEFRTQATPRSLVLTYHT